MSVIGYAGNSVDAAKLFIPKKWSTKILAFNHANSVIENMVNKDYEGEIKNNGDTVNIARDVMPIIKPYSRGQTLEFQNEEILSTQLVIDKAFYAGNYVEPIDQVQSALNRMNMWTKNVGYSFGMNKDKLMLNDIYTDADPSNKGSAAGVESQNINLGTTGAPITIDITNCIEVIEDADQVFNEADVPEDERFITITNAWFTLCKKRMQSSSFYQGAREVLEKGSLPYKIGGFKVFRTNQYESVDDGGLKCYNIIFGRKSGTTLAEQLTKQSEKEGIKEPGLFRYHLTALGYKVIQPTHLGVVYATFA